MHIFIDESGNFVIPEEKKAKVSCVTSLTIPDRHMDAVEKNFSSLKNYWGYEKEVKGSKLSEKQISDTIALLREYDVLLDIVCLNIGNHSSENIDKYKAEQADKLIENLTKEHHENLVRQVHEYRDRLLKLPNQLFIQARISILLIKRILDHSPLYYCQRIPEELGNFVWFVDAKDKNTGKTPFEELWSTLLMPVLESNYHMGVLEGGDYSYFHKYEVESKDMTGHQRSLMSEKSIGGVDIRKLIKEKLFFEDSSTNIGLQLVDIMSSAFCRAMNGNLNIKGWRHLGILMVKAPSIVLLDTDKSYNPDMDERHKLVLIAMKKQSKAMLVNQT
jgi:hypothetical protein